MHACSKIGQAEKGDPKMHATIAELTGRVTQTQLS